MKALQYLQKVGAVAEYEKWDLLMTLVTIVHEEFCPETTVEPDAVLWTQESSDEQEFEERCNALLFATSGDVRALFPSVFKQSETFLKELIETLLEIRAFLYVLVEQANLDPLDDDDFVECYNNMLSLKGKRKFPSKSALLHFYFSGHLVESGQEILSEKAGTQVEFLEKIAQMQAEFIQYATQEFNFPVESVLFENETENPFEGGYQVKVKVRDPSDMELHECTLHWAPWPTAKSQSTSESIQELCTSYNDKEYAKWFSQLSESQG